MNQSTDLTDILSHRRAARAALLLVAALFGLSCAGQIAPSGGPPDTTPPEIIATAPAPRTLSFRGEEIHLEFSEYVDRRSFEESVFLSPPLGRLQFDWSGTEVNIRFPDSLRPNTTYIMTIGTDVKDVRERGNRMTASFALPFSTGDYIDSAAIAGKVFDKEPEGVTIFAYNLSRHPPDSVNPSAVKPDFVTQTGKDGTFRLPYLPLGPYRLFAVGDEYKNFLYDRQIDRYGVATGDVRLSPETPVVSGVQFRLSREDTSAPFLSSVKALDRRHLLARFSEAMADEGMGTPAFTLVDTLSGTALPVLEVAFTDTSRLDAQIVTGAQDSTRLYRLSVTSLRDRAGNAIAAASASGIFTGSALEDTTRPPMTLPFTRDSVRDVPADVALAFSWKEPVRKASFERGLSLLDSAGSALPGSLRWDGAMNAVFEPKEPLARSGRYALRLVLDSVADASGNRYPDSVLVLHFQIGDDRQTSSIAGSLLDEGAAGKLGQIHLFAENLGSAELRRYEAVLDSSGPFQFPRVAEGRYAFEMFRDDDRNGMYSYGVPFPFQASEPFGVHGDTVKVRARWPLEGMVLRLPLQP